MKLFQINTVVNSGSTGRIAEALGNEVIQNGWQSCIAFGRNQRQSSSKIIKIGNNFEIYNHVLFTRLFDKHGFASVNATKQLINQIEEEKPDVIHLHNIHGYYLNVKILFEYLKKCNIPIVWTLHDCWAFTGHCSYYSAAGCNRWQKQCYSCPEKKMYPKSVFIDNSKNNFLQKKEIFTGVKNLMIVTPSKWLSDELKKSFLQNYKTAVINNGIDLSIFKQSNTDLPITFDKSKKIILGVANVWTNRKGLQDFIKLSNLISEEFQIVLVGLTKKQLKSIPSKIIGICHTESTSQLASLYSIADVFVNPTYEDNFPTTNIESLACGTPVITYDVGGCSEIIDNQTGAVIQVGCIDEVVNKIKEITSLQKSLYSEKCITRANSLFNATDKYKQYFELYKMLIKGASL